jgi:hypothetical protein
MTQLKDLNIAEEMQKMEYEPLNAVEMSLVRWSLGLGVTLLVVLYVVSAVFFPGGH